MNSKFQLEEFFIDKNKILAHITKNKADESLEEHLSLSFLYYEKLCKVKNIDKSIKKLIKKIKLDNGISLKEEESELIYKLFYNAIWLHDLGKGNLGFQKNKMKNSLMNYKKNYDRSNHSILGSYIYGFFSLEFILNELEENNPEIGCDEVALMFFMVMGFSYGISKHHGSLGDDYFKSIEKFHEEFKVFIEDQGLELYKNEIIENSNTNRLSFAISECMTNSEFERFLDRIEDIRYYYLLIKLIHSVIIACDFYATGEYMSDSIPDFGIIEDVDKYILKFEEDKIIKGIRSYSKKNSNDTNNINDLRTELFLESEEMILKNSDKNIFYLEAPTGSGKTLTSINLALNLIKKDKNLNKIFYIFPFNTLSDQTESVLSSLFGKEKVAVINSTTPIKASEESNYNKQYMDYIFIHYPITLMSHVGFFNRLFSPYREMALPLVHIANSVVIIDELQNYDNKKWREMIEMLELYSEILNIKIIFMSATLPGISKLSKFKNLDIVSLNKNPEKYFEAPCFKNRVTLNFDLLDKKIDMDDLVEFLSRKWNEKNKRILVEFVKKDMARDFFNKVKLKFPNRRIEELTGDDNLYRRDYLIKDLKETGEKEVMDILVVATQVIEAGVDIDMDIGFKDISLIDSEEQFLGRINRSFKRQNSTAYFFNLGGAVKTYKNDYRLNFTLKDKKFQDVLKNKKFNSYFSELLKIIGNEKNGFGKNSIENFYEDMTNLNFYEIHKKLKPIETDSYQLFLGYEIDLKNFKGKGIIDGKKVWDKYKHLIEADMAFTEKQIKLQEMRKKISLFTYTIYDIPTTYDDSIGRLYYIDDGKEFIEDCKFDRKKYYENMKIFDNSLFV